ncbi:hypothetical protein PJM51_01255 [Mycobacterium kansasii]|uniref:Uncharacterized protein n=1 Tax=Mycobacterium attenuatum TaxID=2341086 RepID=A0A498PU61_9MYCO|nr:hypothetical protein [Mycobacterium attenuatum]VBA35621.1 hypothetical protein LAUMK136_01103 [Mycobacterium attenuatum]VBA48204.1 hypothetical protein LAUMK191_01102 [Mycobacterium attenuatum]
MSERAGNDFAGAFLMLFGDLAYPAEMTAVGPGLDRLHRVILRW